MGVRFDDKETNFVRQETDVGGCVFGANDAAVNHKREYAVSLDEYEKNMRAILSMYKNVQRIVVICRRLLKRTGATRERDDTLTLDRLWSAHGEIRGCCGEGGGEMSRRGRCVRGFKKLGGGDLSEYFTDGLHFSERG